MPIREQSIEMVKTEKANDNLPNKSEYNSENKLLCNQNEKEKV